MALPPTKVCVWGGALGSAGAVTETARRPDSTAVGGLDLTLVEVNTGPRFPVLQTAESGRLPPQTLPRSRRPHKALPDSNSPGSSTTIW